MNASQFVREKYTRARMIEQFHKIYAIALQSPKKRLSFDTIFGSTPSEWFLSCQRDAALYSDMHQARLDNDPLLRLELMEVTKGSISQFSSYFPDDPILRQWRERIQGLLGTSI